MHWLFILHPSIVLYLIMMWFNFVSFLSHYCSVLKHCWFVSMGWGAGVKNLHYECELFKEYLAAQAKGILYCPNRQHASLAFFRTFCATWCKTGTRCELSFIALTQRLVSAAQHCNVFHHTVPSGGTRAFVQPKSMLVLSNRSALKNKDDYLRIMRNNVEESAQSGDAARGSLGGVSTLVESELFM